MTTVLTRSDIEDGARHINAVYCPFPLESDARRYGLTTSSMRLRSGSVVVRHGRRTDSDTATILLHGAAGSWTTWTPLLTAADLTRTPMTDLIIPDLPGWGDSALPTDGFTIDALAAAIADIARALGYRRWHLVGHSMGGFVALSVAATETRATVSVGLVSATTFSVIDSVRHPIRKFSTLPGYTALLAVFRMLHPLGRVGRAFVSGLGRLSLLRPLAAPLFRHPARMHASVIDALAIEVRPSSFALASTRAGQYDAAAAWTRIDCPVRAVQGESDVFVATSDANALTQVIDDFAVQTISGTGHFAHIERPFAVAAFLARPALAVN